MTDEKIVLGESEKDTFPKKQKPSYSEKICKVISYDKKAKTLDVSFDGFGIRLSNVDNFDGDKATIKYKGKIGKSNFTYKL